MSKRLFIPKDAVCSIEGCDKDCRRGSHTDMGPICRMHATRYSRNGTYESIIASSTESADASMERRFLASLVPGQLKCGSRCVLFTGYSWSSPSNSGEYGRIGTTKRPEYPYGYELAHRYAWKYWIGPIEAGMDLDHEPDCPKTCVNPEHLQKVTRSAHSTLGNARGEIGHKKVRTRE